MLKRPNFNQKQKNQRVDWIIGISIFSIFPITWEFLFDIASSSFSFYMFLYSHFIFSYSIIFYSVIWFDPNVFVQVDRFIILIKHRHPSIINKRGLYNSSSERKQISRVNCHNRLVMVFTYSKAAYLDDLVYSVLIY